MSTETKIIAAELSLNTGNTTPQLKDVTKHTKESKDEFKDLTKEVEKSGKTMQTSGGSFGKLRDQMSSLPGPLGAAGDGVGKLNTSFKALLANPVVLIITAIIGVLALLYKSFTNTFEGAQKVEQVFAGVKAAAQSLFDNLGRIANAIVKFFTFDFSGAIDEIKGVADEAAKAYQAMADLTAEAQKLHQEQLRNDLDAAERQKKLAILREQANDDSIPLSERKKALKELRDEAEKNAKEDIDLAKRTAENKIKQLTLEKDGERKNQDEINAIKIEQIKVETDNANELRRINKQVTAAEKQEAAERKAEMQRNAEAAKAERQKLVEFTNKLMKLQQENELLQIKDSYEKEKKALENKLADEKRANELAFKDRKITREQYDKLNRAYEIQSNLQLADLQEKHNKEKADKEVAFQKELNAILNKTKLQGIVDARDQERIQLQLGYEEKLNDAIQRYKDDQTKFQQIKQALDDQLRAEQDKMNEKFKKEDDKKAFELEDQKNKKIMESRTASFESRRLALEDEVLLVQDAFDRKIIAEIDYNNRMSALTEARKELAKAEMETKLDTLGKIGDAFGNLSDIIGRQTVIGKALAVAQATIATIQSAVSSYNSLANIPVVGPVLGGIAAAAAVASGVANVKKILAVQIPGQGSGGGSVPSVSTPAAPIAPTQATTKLDQKSLNQIGNATVRAYVLDSDATNHRDRNERLNRAARIDG